MFGDETKREPLFSVQSRSDFLCEGTRRSPRGRDQPTLDESQLEITSAELTDFSGCHWELTIKIPCLGNTKWFLVYADEIPFSNYFPGETPAYRVFEDRNNNAYLELLTRLSIPRNQANNPDKTVLAKMNRAQASKLIQAINAYIVVLDVPQYQNLERLSKRIDLDE